MEPLGSKKLPNWKGQETGESTLSIFEKSKKKESNAGKNANDLKMLRELNGDVTLHRTCKVGEKLLQRYSLILWFRMWATSNTTASPIKGIHSQAAILKFAWQNLSS